MFEEISSQTSFNNLTLQIAVQYFLFLYNNKRMTSILTSIETTLSITKMFTQISSQTSFNNSTHQIVVLTYITFCSCTTIAAPAHVVQKKSTQHYESQTM